MNYDDWKLESPEDEDERLNGPMRRRQARLEYLADQRDEFLEAEQMEKNNPDDDLCDHGIHLDEDCEQCESEIKAITSLMGEQ